MNTEALKETIRRELPALLRDDQRRKGVPLLERTASVARELAPDLDYWTVRVVAEESESLSVRQGVVEPTRIQSRCGAMISLIRGTGMGYAATSNLSREGLGAAFGRAADWAELHARLGLLDATLFPRIDARSDYRTQVREPWDARPTEDKLALLQDACTAIKIDARILDWSAWIGYRRVSQLLVTGDGGRSEQILEYVNPGLTAVAHAESQTQRRTGGGADRPGQGGLERISQVGLLEAAPQVAEDALALLSAPECPSGIRDLVLTPGQMAMQIHESIGHPLELDRILGDERNYAGTSFVTPAMFGSYRYGSDLLNVTFDPTLRGELATYAADDEGTPAERAYLIRDGILERPLGGRLSQARSGLPGVAAARACGWDRPPIDRMANINLEPGEESLEDLIGRVERGVLMDTNRSWSIDDSRNKFQFGCELGRLIQDGELKGLVRNPGYRGISASFWRSLDGVGDRNGLELGGVLTCGKGEPNQAVYVGHAAPPCLFRNLTLFGGEP
jgi:predicted Zn-dependent protease